MLRNIIINKGQFCNIILVDGELVGTFFTYEDEEDGELMISGEFFSKRYGDYKFELSYTRKKNNRRYRRNKFRRVPIQFESRRNIYTKWYFQFRKR